jgi:hypothetical protein
MNRSYKRLCLAAGLLLAGCSVAPLNFAPSNIPSSTDRLDAALISTNVTVASKTEAKGKLNTAGSEADVAALWKSSLDDAIIRMAAFRDDAPTKLSLVVKILELDLRDLGYNARTTARYELVDRNTGRTVYTTEVHTTEGASDYMGVNRARKSANRSVAANIEEFLKRLATAKLS